MYGRSFVISRLGHGLLVQYDGQEWPVCRQQAALSYNVGTLTMTFSPHACRKKCFKSAIQRYRYVAGVCRDSDLRNH